MLSDAQQYHSQVQKAYISLKTTNFSLPQSLPLFWKLKQFEEPQQSYLWHLKKTLIWKYFRTKIRILSRCVTWWRDGNQLLLANEE